MKSRFYIFFFTLLIVPTLTLKAAYKMGEAAPVKVSNSASDAEPATESTTKVSNSTHRKTKNVAFPRDSAASNPEIPILESLSERYNVPVDRLQYYRSLHFGYEEIVPALVVSKEAQVEVGRVLKLRMDGQSWDAIAKSFFIDLKPLNKEVGEVLKPIRIKLPSRALTERPANQSVK